MAKYTIVAESITGVKGKQLLKGEEHEETEFIADHIADLLTNSFIKEEKVTAEAKPSKSKDNGAI